MSLAINAQFSKFDHRSRQPIAQASQRNVRLIIKNHRGDCRGETDSGCEQGLGDAGRDNRKTVSLAAAMPVKLRMMPQTVPNSPTKGAVEPTVARKGSPV